MLKGIALFVCLLLVTFSSARSQGETAVPFLLFTPSIEANGMGGIGTGLSPENALAPYHNPGTLGLFRGFLSGGFYAPATNWLPLFQISDLKYSAWAVNAGVRLNDYLSLPFNLIVAAGYSRIDLNMGRFTITGPTGPQPIGYFEPHESSSNETFAIGLGYIMRIGVGVTFKSIKSALSPVGTEAEQGLATASSSAIDYGFAVQLPVVEAIENLAGVSLEVLPKIKPVFDVTFTSAKSNRGDPMVYVDAAQADPLPRLATLGLASELGVVSLLFGDEWKVATFKISREAQQVLVNRNPDGTWKYIDGTGDISFADNVIGGKAGPKIYSRKGWQFQIAEALYLRGGSMDLPYLKCKTSGFGIQLSGLLKVLLALAPEIREGTWVRDLAENFDIQYQTGSYTGTSSPIDDTNFKGFNIVLKKIPYVR
jgi:hypothetical protein